VPAHAELGLPPSDRFGGRASVRWLVATFAFSVVALAVFAPSLAVIVPGLPNDHYHAFLDPIVLAMAGAGIAILAAPRASVTPVSGATGVRGVLGRRVVAGALTAVLVGIAVTSWPPARSPDGGWPLADDAASRVLATTGATPFALDGIPSFKNDNALRFPLERRSAPVLPAVAEDEPPPAEAALLVLVCDPLFDEVVGAPCGGAAEDAWLATAGWSDVALLDRFESGPRRVVSVFGRVP
jgi:hypothetical protein